MRVIDLLDLRISFSDVRPVTCRLLSRKSTRCIVVLPPKSRISDNVLTPSFVRCTLCKPKLVKLVFALRLVLIFAMKSLLNIFLPTFSTSKVVVANNRSAMVWAHCRVILLFHSISTCNPFGVVTACNAKLSALDCRSSVPFLENLASANFIDDFESFDSMDVSLFKLSELNDRS